MAFRRPTGHLGGPPGQRPTLRDEPLRRRLERRLAALRNERAPWAARWAEVQRVIVPERGRLSLGAKRAASDVDAVVRNTGKMALRTLASGMAAGITSPAQRWFRLTVEDGDLAEAEGVRAWLDAVEARIEQVLAKGDFYQSAASLYAELGAFGTGALAHEDDFETISLFKPFTAGEFFIANDIRGRATTVYREFQMTVEALVERFGYGRCSQAARNLYDAGNLDAWITVCQAIEPNGARFRQGGGGAIGLGSSWAYASVYWEAGAEEDRLLSIRGYHECPVHCPRWDVILPDAYGWSPALDALGDVKELQATAAMILEATGRMARPPLQGPATLTQELNLAPGAYNPIAGAGQKVESLYAAGTFSIQEALLNVESLKQSIREAFFADLFLMLSMSDRRQVTAREIEERHEEKLLMLGPVLTRLNVELLSPVIDRIFGQLARGSQAFWPDRGIIPPPPDVLGGQELRVEYVSSLQQAQRAVRAAPVYRLIEATAMVGQIDPAAIRKLDGRQALDELGELIGVPARVLRSDEVCEAMDQADAERAQMAQAMQAGAVAADAAAKLGRAQVTPETALGQIVEGAANG